MALPSTGSISFSQINVELGRAGTTEIGLNQAEAGTLAPINPVGTNKPNGTTPNSISEWYGYDHIVFSQGVHINPTPANNSNVSNSVTVAVQTQTSANRFNFQLGNSDFSDIFNSRVRTTNSTTFGTLQLNLAFRYRSRVGFFDGTTFFFGAFSVTRIFTVTS